jgi:hypothetical protein
MRRAVSLILALAMVSAGCQTAWKPSALVEGPGAGTGYLSKGAVAQDAPSDKAPAVESALLWSEKYARTVEDLSQEQQRGRKLLDENRTLQQQLDAAKADVAKATSELEAANTLLIEVRQENNRWKADVLGYRDEMRRAHLTELEALGKVLRLLGGETPQPEAVSVAPAAEPAALKKAAAPTTGVEPTTPPRKAATTPADTQPAAQPDKKGSASDSTP